MTRISIAKTNNHGAWLVKWDGGAAYYPSFESASAYVNKHVLRFRKEVSAYSMVTSISVNLLDVAGESLVNKLKRTKCKGITPRQYGYLKGIYERQQREW